MIYYEDKTKFIETITSEDGLSKAKLQAIKLQQNNYNKYNIKNSDHLQKLMRCIRKEMVHSTLPDTAEQGLFYYKGCPVYLAGTFATPMSEVPSIHTHVARSLDSGTVFRLIQDV